MNRQFRTPYYKMIEVLCQYRATPNRQQLRVSAWNKALKQASPYCRDEDVVLQWTLIIELLITKGDGLVNPFVSHSRFGRRDGSGLSISEATRDDIAFIFRYVRPEISTHLLDLLEAKVRESEEAHLAKMQAMAETIERLKAQAPQHVPFYKLAISRITSFIPLAWNQNMATVE